MAASKKNVEAYHDSFYKAVGRLKARKSGFTVDDVVAKIGNPPQGRRALSGLMLGAANKFDLAVVDEVTSQQPTRKYSTVAVWSV